METLRKMRRESKIKRGEEELNMCDLVFMDEVVTRVDSKF